MHGDSLPCVMSCLFHVRPAPPLLFGSIKISLSFFLKENIVDEDEALPVMHNLANKESLGFCHNELQGANGC